MSSWTKITAQEGRPFFTYHCEAGHSWDVPLSEIPRYNNHCPECAYEMSKASDVSSKEEAYRGLPNVQEDMAEGVS